MTSPKQRKQRRREQKPSHSVLPPVVLCHPNTDPASPGLTLLGDALTQHFPEHSPPVSGWLWALSPRGTDCIDCNADCIERLFMSSHTEGTPPNLPFPSNFPPLSSGSSSLPGPGALLQCTPLSNSHQKLSILLPSHFFFPFCFPPVLYLTLKSSPSSFPLSFFPLLLSSCALPHPQELSILLPCLFFSPFCFLPVLHFSSRRDIPGVAG